MTSHVAILVLDTPIPGIADKFGDFGDNVVSLMKDSRYKYVKYQIAFDLDSEHRAQHIADLNGTFENLTANIKNQLVQGVILTGSRSDSFMTGNPWIDALDKFIKETLYRQPNLPIVGLCFGHQILAKNLGCKVNRNSVEHGWESGTTTISLNKSILDIPSSPFRSALRTEEGKILEHINLVEMHLDVVFGMPLASTTQLISETAFQNLGSTTKCSIQGLVTESGPIKLLTFQGHPEFSTDETLSMLQRKYETGLIDLPTLERSVYNTKNLENQGYIVGRAIKEFIDTYNQ